MQFEGKVAIVTGAGSGIGSSICRLLAAHGARVVAADIDLERAKAVAKTLRGRAFAIAVDVGDPESVERMVGKTVERCGGLHLAVNNAGIPGARARTADHSLEDWHRVIQINLNGIFYGLRAQIPAIMASGGGAIVNMTSVFGIRGAAGSPAYIAAKHGVVGLTKAAAIEYSARGVRINAVGPAFIRTELVEAVLAEEGLEAGLVARHPIGRLGQPNEVAELTAFLLSERASFISGSYHLVDGAYSAM